MKVEFVKENSDGGADYLFSLTPEEIDAFVRIGIITALSNMIVRAELYKVEGA